MSESLALAPIPELLALFQLEEHERQRTSEQVIAKPLLELARYHPGFYHFRGQTNGIVISSGESHMGSIAID